MTTVLLTGSAGFIAGYLVEELLAAGHHVIGVDNFSKYGTIEKSYQNHPNYRFAQGDAKDTVLLTDLAAQCDHFVMCAAKIGGISYFHEYAYDLIAENERIVAASFDAAIQAFTKARLQKVTVLSSSMPIACFTRTIHIPGFGMKRSHAGRAASTKYGALIPAAMAANMAKIIGGVCANAKPSAGPRNGAVHGVAMRVAKAPCKNVPT